MVSDRVRRAVVPSAAVATSFSETLSRRLRRSRVRPFLFSLTLRGRVLPAGIVTDAAPTATVLRLIAALARRATSFSDTEAVGGLAAVPSRTTSLAFAIAVFG